MQGPREIAVVSPPEMKGGRIDATGQPSSAPPEAGGVAVEQCRAWLSWAAAQVDACLSSDSLASAQLLAALADVLGPAQSRAGAALEPTGEVDGKMSAVIIAVQSHDRVMQALAHVAESLRTVEAQLGDSQRADSEESWRMLSETQIRAFSMPQERALFARMVALGDDGKREADEADVDSEGTVELFTIDPGPQEP